jgi:hypothetical protein
LSVLRGAALCSGCAPRGGAESPPFATMAAATNQNLFPDLHHKMSKKIAQLTKVIYHLNSKNEEHTDDLTSLADAYETEIDGVRLQFRGPLPLISQCPRPRLRSASARARPLRAVPCCQTRSPQMRALAESSSRRCSGCKCRSRWSPRRFSGWERGLVGICAGKRRRRSKQVLAAVKSVDDHGVGTLPHARAQDRACVQMHVCSVS